MAVRAIPFLDISPVCLFQSLFSQGSDLVAMGFCAWLSANLGWLRNAKLAQMHLSLITKKFELQISTRKQNISSFAQFLCIVLHFFFPKT